MVGSFPTSYAQVLTRYGLKVALTSADQKYDLKYVPQLQTRRRIGFNAAAFGEWFNIPHFTLLTQIEYSQRGVGQDFTVVGSDPQVLEIKTLYSRLNYLSVPILAKVMIPSKSVTPFLLAGPRLDFLLGYQSDENAFNQVYDSFDKTLLGASFGVGVQTDAIIPVGVVLEIRYNVDFADSYSTDLLRVRNNAFDIWVGVAF